MRNHRTPDESRLRSRHPLRREFTAKCRSHPLGALGERRAKGEVAVEGVACSDVALCEQKRRDVSALDCAPLGGDPSERDNYREHTCPRAHVGMIGSPSRDL